MTIYQFAGGSNCFVVESFVLLPSKWSPSSSSSTSPLISAPCLSSLKRNHHRRNHIYRRSRGYRTLELKLQDQPQQQQPSSPFTTTPTSTTSASPPIPAMPSDLFGKMAQSQLEFLASSLSVRPESMILYLPQENQSSGQLEFTPAVIFPNPNSERVFIASDAASGVAPTLPKTLTKLPGFSHASSLLPGYPMLSSQQSTEPGVGAVEEVLCDIRFKTAALSVPLLSGPQTVGVLLISPSVSMTAPSSTTTARGTMSKWTDQDKQHVSAAARSLSMALTMDNERTFLTEQYTSIRQNLSDSLHQVKNPLQALRTYGKILQRQISETAAAQQGDNDERKSGGNAMGGTLQLLELADRLMVQSDRVVDLLGPMDSLVESMDLLPPAQNATDHSMVLWRRQGQQLQLHKQQDRLALPLPKKEMEENDGEEDLSSTKQRTTKRQKKISEGPGQRSHLSSSSSPPHSVNDSSEPSSRRRRRTPQQAPQKVAATSAQATTSVGDFEVEMVFVEDVLKPILETYAVIASERGISFNVVVGEDEENILDNNVDVELPGVMAAPKSLQEALSNVLDNAFKYVTLPKAVANDHDDDDSSFTQNRLNPSVQVRIFPNIVENEDGSDSNTDVDPGVTILVEDNGPGIPEEDTERVFERGYRGERTRSVNGTGIGLPIARALMRRMGGDLKLLRRKKDKDVLDGTAIELKLYRKKKKKS